MKNFLPAVSVIVPVYNAENYIEECLQSLLDQTFQDFEALVIDDASTDRSVEIVESIAPKFDGRLILVKREKNSGGMVAIPRNIGLGLARGDYIAFLDNDDLLMPTALDELYKITEDTQADVLNASKFFVLQGDAPRKIASFEKRPPVDRPTLLDDNLVQRVDDFIRFHFHFNVWTKFYRRRFLVENDIRFPELPASDDMFFSFYCLMRAKRYVRIPNPFYIWRVRDDSVSHEKLTPEQEVRKWITIAVEGTHHIEDFMRRTEFFERNPQSRYAATNRIINDQLHYLQPKYRSTPIPQMNELIRAELARHSTDTTTLLSQVINTLNVLRIQLRNEQRLNSQLRQQLTQLTQLTKEATK